MRSNSPAMRFLLGRQRLPKMRPSMLEFMWQITYGFISRALLSPRSGGTAPAHPVAHRFSHDELEVAALEPRQLLGEHRRALPPRARHPGDVGAPEHPLRAERVEAAVQVLVKAAEWIRILGVARLTGRLDRDVRVFGERQQLWLEPIGGLAFAARRYRHVVDNQFEARVALGDPVDGR